MAHSNFVKLGCRRFVMLLPSAIGLKIEFYELPENQSRYGFRVKNLCKTLPYFE
jgi:hypothetical protein